MINQKEFNKVDLGVCIGHHSTFVSMIKKKIRSQSTMCLEYPERALDLYYTTDWPEFALCQRIFEFAIERKLWILTRSPALIETLWALFIIRKSRTPKRDTAKLLPWATKDDVKALLKKNIQVFAIGKNRLFTLEELDVRSPSKLISSWGGLLDYSRLVGGIVRNTMQGQ